MEKPDEDITPSDEERLLHPEINCDRKNRRQEPASGPQRQSKAQRNQMLDANRKTSPLDMIGSKGATTNSTVRSNQRQIAGSTPISKKFEEFQQQIAQKGNFGAASSSTSLQPERAAKLNDLRLLMSGAEARGIPVSDMMPLSSQMLQFRPALASSSSLPNLAQENAYANTGGATGGVADANEIGQKKKRTRRGGRVLREKAMRKEMRATAEQTNNNAGNKKAPSVQPISYAQPSMNMARIPQKQSANKPMHRSLQSPAMKRGRATGGTPPDLVHQNKKKTEPHTIMTANQTASASSIASVIIDNSLMVAIIDSPTPGTLVPINKTKYDLLYEAMNQMLFLELSKSSITDPIPTYSDNMHTRGAMKVRCSTPGAKQWLTAAVPYIPTLWEGMSLNVIDFEKLPRQHKVLGFIPHWKGLPEQAKSMLGVMNKCLNVNCWSILSSKTTDKGAHITFGIDEDQLVMLSACNFKLHCGFGSALFKDISKKKDSRTTEKLQAGSELDVETSDMNVDSEQEDNITVIVPQKKADETDSQQQKVSTEAAQVQFGPGAAASAPIVAVEEKTESSPDDMEISSDATSDLGKPLSQKQIKESGA